jgi:mannose-1-phosphate guanylyltransferase
LGSERPKQFCRIVGSGSMLRHTWGRAARLVPPERIVTIITAGQERYIEEEARHGVPGTVLVQPENKETAPGLLLPLVWIAHRSPVATIAVFPADHFIWEEDRFERHMWSAVGATARLPRHVILVGVEADGPETDYGYIVRGRRLATGVPTELYAVSRFWEKPDRRTAARLFARGHFWNTLVMAGRLETYLSLAAAYLPKVLGPLRAVEHSLSTAPAVAALAAAYRRIPPTNLSRALLARCSRSLMVLGVRGVYWSDWGDPNRIVRTLHRFNLRPSWLPAYLQTEAQAAPAS